MIPFFVGFLTCISAFFRFRYNLGFETLARRQQLGVFKQKHPHPCLRIQDRIFWILLRRFWPAWSNTLVIVKPETAVAWHRAGFRGKGVKVAVQDHGSAEIEPKYVDLLAKRLVAIGFDAAQVKKELK